MSDAMNPVLPLCRRIRMSLAIAALAFASSTYAQTTEKSPAPATDAEHFAAIEHRLNDVTEALSQTQKNLQESMKEVQALRAQLEELRAEKREPANATVAQPAGPGEPREADLEALREQQDVLQAEIKQHEQSKVETASKYSLRVTGMVLFNAFSNAGVVDNTELPTIAYPRSAGGAHGSVGATLHQTILGVEAKGPDIAGAGSSAAIDVDFFGSPSTNTYGYTTLTGTVRMRETSLDLDWSRTTAEVGYTGPLISPLSPTSYATVAQPALSGAGNLWTWSPQVRVEQRFPLAGDHGLAIEGGLIFPQSPDYSNIQLDGPVEAARRPGVEGRVSYRANSSAVVHTLQIGVGAYTANQFYNSGTHIHSWAVTGDLDLPLSRWVELTGEVYRGRALGGLGGGGYKDILTGTDPLTAQSRTTGVDTAGGWAQLKMRFTPMLEANAAFGLDDAFSSSFDSVILPTTISPSLLTARNNSVFGNLIFRPKAALIFSPEYRRVMTWRYSGPGNVANIFTLSAGYQF